MIKNLTLSGNLGHDPETRHYGEKQDQPVTTFSLAFQTWAGTSRVGSPGLL